MKEKKKSCWLFVHHKLLWINTNSYMGIWGEHGYHELKQQFASTWYDSQTVENTLKENLSHASTDGDRQRFKGTSLTITPSGKCGYVCKSIMGCKSLRVDNNTHKFHDNDLLAYFSKDKKKLGSFWNFVVFDFIEWQPYINRFLIGLNYSNKVLEIQSAMV